MQRHECIDTIRALAPSPRIDWRSWAAQGLWLVKRDATALTSLFQVWARRAEGRRALAEMDLHRLRDMGLTGDQVRREIAKPFWKG